MKTLISILLFILLVSCRSINDRSDNTPGNGLTAMDEQKIITIVKAHVKEHFPQSVTDLELRPIFTDRSTYWEVSFELPEFTLGGTPVVWVDKETHKVVKSFHTQ